MSVRAYRVNSIDQERIPSFNLWNDNKLVSFLDGEYSFFDKLPDGSGHSELPIEALKKALEKKVELELGEITIKQLEADIKWCEEHNNEYIEYICY